MDRLRGVFSLVIITAGVMGVLRVAHVGIPLIVPEARQGTLTLAGLDEVRPLAGFAPLVPAYRPSRLGASPAAMTFSYHPHPTFRIVWQAADEYLAVTQQHFGPKPVHPPLAQPLEGIPGSTWWTDGARSQVILARGEFWILIDTNLPAREVIRFVDTLTPY